MISAKSIKSTALVHLNGKWFWAAVCSLLPFFCFAAVFVIIVVLSSVIGVFSLLVGITLNVFVVKPVFLGSIRLFWLLANNRQETVSDAFYYFYCIIAKISLQVYLKIFPIPCSFGYLYDFIFFIAFNLHFDKRHDRMVKSRKREKEENHEFRIFIT